MGYLVTKTTRARPPAPRSQMAPSSVQYIPPHYVAISISSPGAGYTSVPHIAYHTMGAYEARPRYEAVIERNGFGANARKVNNA